MARSSRKGNTELKLYKRRFSNNNYHDSTSRFSELINKVSNYSGIPEAELLRLLKNKRIKLSNVVSRSKANSVHARRAISSKIEVKFSKKGKPGTIGTGPRVFK